MKKEIKGTFELLLPPFVLSIIRALRPSVRKRLAECRDRDDAIQRLRDAFEVTVGRAAEGSFRLRPDIEFRIHPECRTGFEHFCFRSPEMVEEMDCFLALSRSCQRFLDVGALHGAFSLAFTSRNATAQSIAFEPSPLAYSRLLYNTYKNPACQIKAIECALTDQRKLLLMHYEWEHVIAGPSTQRNGNTLSVECDAGDAMCGMQQFDPDVIKIDVEGHEVKVIRGLRGVITRFRPTVFLEIHPEMIQKEGDRVGEIVDFFDKLDYTAVNNQGSKVDSSSIEHTREHSRVVFKG